MANTGYLYAGLECEHNATPEELKRSYRASRVSTTPTPMTTRPPNTFEESVRPTVSSDPTGAELPPLRF